MKGSSGLKEVAKERKYQKKELAEERIYQKKGGTVLESSQAEKYILAHIFPARGSLV
jgi:hypothetical protein